VHWKETCKLSAETTKNTIKDPAHSQIEQPATPPATSFETKSEVKKWWADCHKQRHRVHTEFVRGIVSGGAKALGEVFSPSLFDEHVSADIPFGFSDYSVDIVSLENTLVELGIEETTYGRPKVGSRGENGDHNPELQCLIDGITRHAEDAHSDEDTLEKIHKYSGGLNSGHVRAFAEVLPLLLQIHEDNSTPFADDFTKMLSKTILEVGLKSKEYDSDLEAARQSVYDALGRMPPVLPAADLITVLLRDNFITPTSAVVHSFVNNALRRAYLMVEPVRDVHSTRLVQRAYNEENNVESEFGKESGSRDGQKRILLLLVLFLRGLILRHLMTVESLTFQLQEMGVRYIWIPEVREFWGEVR
jgi:hypothetical protein